MHTNSHNDLVIEQYNPRANAYLTSSVHAKGEDLELMASLVGRRPDAIALDVGCGGGHVAFRLAPLLRQVVAYDLSESMLATVAAEAGKRGLDNIEVRQGAAESLSCTPEAFDIVATRYSAHHWHAFQEGLARMNNALKDGGLAIFMDVVAPENPLLDTWLQSLELLRDPSHVRDASVPEWREALSKAGFVVGEVTKFRLRLEFSSWVERMNTPKPHVDAIRSLQNYAVPAVREYFEIEGDGSFTLDTALMVASKA